MSRRSLVSDKRFPWQFNWLTAGQCFVPHYHRRLLETYTVVACEPGDALFLDSERHTLSPGRIFGIAPGCVHHGVCSEATILLCVLRKHNEYENGDMHFADLPDPPDIGQRFWTGDLTARSFRLDHWPYAVCRQRLEGDAEFSNPRAFVTYVMLPGQEAASIEINGRWCEIRSASLVALVPGCTYRLDRSVDVYRFVMLAEGWKNKVEALEYCPSSLPAA